MTNRVRLIALLLIIVGVFLRLEGLGNKAYGNDETTTSLRVAGATIADYYALFDGKARTVADLRVYQERLPKSSFADVNHSLAIEDPQHPPLYYDFERLWTAFDQGVAGHRRLSVVFGTLLIPAMGWLLLEMSASMTIALIGMGLVTVSPFFVVYAQQAREYSLWALLTALSSALLLRLLRSTKTSLGAWVGYGVLLIGGCLTDILFVGVLAAHVAVCLLAQARIDLTQRQRISGIAAVVIAGVISGVAWLPALLANRSAVTNNAFLALALPFKVFAAKWLVNIAATVVDFGLLPAGYGPHVLVLIGMLLAGLSLVGIIIATVALCKAPRDERVLMALALTLIPALMLIVPDLLKHESRSTAARYLVPTWIGIEAIIALAFGALLQKKPSIASALLALIFASGFGSAVLRAPVPAWWTDWSAYGVVAQANALEHLPDAAPQVAFINEGAGWDFSVMELVNRLPAGYTFRLYNDTNAYLASKPMPRYLLDPSSTVLTHLHAAGAQMDEIALGTTHLGPAIFAHKTDAASDSGTPISLWNVH